MSRCILHSNSIWFKLEVRLATNAIAMFRETFLWVVNVRIKDFLGESERCCCSKDVFHPEVFIEKYFLRRRSCFYIGMNCRMHCCCKSPCYPAGAAIAAGGYLIDKKRPVCQCHLHDQRRRGSQTLGRHNAGIRPDERETLDEDNMTAIFSMVRLHIVVS